MHDGFGVALQIAFSIQLRGFGAYMNFLERDSVPCRRKAELRVMTQGSIAIDGNFASVVSEISHILVRHAGTVIYFEVKVREIRVDFARHIVVPEFASAYGRMSHIDLRVRRGR